jgi:transposase-like protein
MIAANLRKRRPRPHTIWHLDEAYLKIDGRLVYLWRAVDAEGEVLDVLVQSKRNKHAALKLMRKLLRKYAFVAARMITDELRSYGAAVRELGIENRHAVDGKTIAPRTRISQLGEESARCKASRVQDRRRDFYPLTQRSTTPSTSSAISRRGRRTEPSGLRQ